VNHKHVTRDPGCHDGIKPGPTGDGSAGDVLCFSRGCC